ncbi:NAD(P)-dependent oxidoreductase [Prochlorococcus sp. AH-716-M10]|nr:NAD(P)-dependent oxidoreductase [Prochlorococcus sp. AH-716-M10]
MNDFKYLKIAVTGATGWIGKNLIETLMQKIGYETFIKNVFLYGSKEKILIINKNCRSVYINKLSKLKNDSVKFNFDLVIHSAFLVRDHLNGVGIKNYIKINKEITNLVLQSLKRLTNPKLILLSSGAASAHKDISDEIALIKDPYGFLKREEEIIFNNIADTAIFRVYALSGRFMRNPERFALGNFILQAKKGAIKIESEMSVIRGYVSATDLSNIIFEYFLKENTLNSNNIINAVSEEISLLNLAQIISEKFGNVPIIHNIDKNLSMDSYSYPPTKFQLLSKKLNYSLMSIDAQINQTISDFNF